MMQNSELVQKKNNNSQCKFYVVRKKRFCRMTVKTGYYYCGEHEPKSDNIDESTNSRLRVPCPLDNTHTCFATKLAKHLTKCNAQKIVSKPYLKKNTNAAEYESQMINIGRQLSKVPSSEILDVIKKVNELYEDIKDSVTKSILHHDILTDEINKLEYGESTKRHLIQSSSIIAQLHNSDLLHKKTCYVEFGAGKGKLSFWLSKVIQPFQDSSILLVERASLRHKMDNKLDKEETCTHRIRADIADLILNEVELIKNSEKIVGITKHLCGDATDLALRCLMNAMKQGVNVHGVVMAFCCHHRCFWPNYTGKDFFEAQDLTKTDFDIICGLVSWATCGSGLSREARRNVDQNAENNQNRTRDDAIGFSRKEKEIIGKKCKVLIDYGRMLFLQKHEFSCSLHYYAEQTVTLENVCVVAKKK